MRESKRSEFTLGINRRRRAGLGLETIRLGAGVPRQRWLFRRRPLTRAVMPGEWVKSEVLRFTHSLESGQVGSVPEAANKLPTVLQAQNSLVTTLLERLGRSALAGPWWL